MHGGAKNAVQFHTKLSQRVIDRNKNDYLSFIIIYPLEKWLKTRGNTLKHLISKVFWHIIAKLLNN